MNSQKELVQKDNKRELRAPFFNYSNKDFDIRLHNVIGNIFITYQNEDFQNSQINNIKKSVLNKDIIGPIW